MTLVSKLFSRGSGPRVVRLYTAMLSAVCVAAWWSWGIQVLPLVGEQGLAPLTAFFARAHAAGTPTFLSAPSLFWLASGDGAILTVVVLGLTAAGVAVLGIKTRSMLILQLILYVSFVTTSGPFLQLLGDKLLLEATVLALVLPADKEAPWLHVCARLLLVKLYLEAGLAQWLLPDHAWLTGTALAPLLETTALPTPLGFLAAQLPPDLLSVLTKIGLFCELIVPWLALAPRPGRLFAAAVLTAMQIAGILLFNLGLFALVAVALHLFCLEDSDVVGIESDIMRASPTLARGFGALTEVRNRLWAPRWRQRLDALLVRTAPALAVLYVVFSAVGLLGATQQSPLALTHSVLERWTQRLTPYHVLNTYAHAPGTKMGRIEPILEVLPQAGEDTARASREEHANSAWHAVALWHEPGDTFVAPHYVAPHQPRLDVQMSAFGRLDHHGPLPAFVLRLMQQLCDDPRALGRLIRPPLWLHPEAVRLTFMRYTFAPWEEYQSNGAYWDRSWVADGPTLHCHSRVVELPQDLGEALP